MFLDLRTFSQYHTFYGSKSLYYFTPGVDSATHMCREFEILDTKLCIIIRSTIFVLLLGEAAGWMFRARQDSPV